LANVEHIRENLDKSVAIANDEQYGLILNLNELKLALQKTASFLSNTNRFTRAWIAWV
jgi:DNA repair protein RecN (Recombination protein N)